MLPVVVTAGPGEREQLGGLDVVRVRFHLDGVGEPAGPRERLRTPEDHVAASGLRAHQRIEDGERRLIALHLDEMPRAAQVI